MSSLFWILTVLADLFTYVCVSVTALVFGAGTRCSTVPSSQSTATSSNPAFTVAEYAVNVRGTVLSFCGNSVRTVAPEKSASRVCTIVILVGQKLMC